MTPTEVAVKLRAFNEWRRGDEDIPQPKPREIGEAIDAAVEMIERLEALRAELKAAHAMALNGVEWKELAQKYEAEISAMKRQAPIAWARKIGLDVPSFGCVTDLKYRPSDIPESAYVPLYAHPGAQPAPSVPEDVMRDAERYRYLRARDDETAGIGCWIEAEGRACDRGWLYGVQLYSAIDTCIEMLAAAPEAKP